VVTIAIAGIIIVFITGFVLSRRGVPYSAVLLAVHKIVAVLMAVALGIFIFRAQREAALGWATWLSVLATALFFVTAVATGGILSAEKPDAEKPWPPVIGTLHKVAPWFTVVSAAATLYLVVG
jgi:hypothetical protein